MISHGVSETQRPIGHDNYGTGIQHQANAEVDRNGAPLEPFLLCHIPHKRMGGVNHLAVLRDGQHDEPVQEFWPRLDAPCAIELLFQFRGHYGKTDLLDTTWTIEARPSHDSVNSSRREAQLCAQGAWIYRHEA